MARRDGVVLSDRNVLECGCDVAPEQSEFVTGGSDPRSNLMMSATSWCALLCRKSVMVADNTLEVWVWVANPHVGR
eukprot:62859-Amphidinium_carterae.1